MCDINMTTFDKGGVNTAWLGGVEFFRGITPLMGWLDKALDVILYCNMYTPKFKN